MSAVLRPFHPVDIPALYRVCLLTGDAGGDATALYRDPDLVGHVYVGPYPAANPSLTFVVHDGEGLAGYLVGTADTAAFGAWCEEHWWPALRERYPLGADDGSADHVLVGHVHAPPTESPPPGHPAHLHIDLLPRLQRQGWGRRLIETFADALRDRGVPGLHLRVDLRNTGARAFYARLGFVADDDPGRLLLTL